MAKTLNTMALLEQPFIKDTDKDVASIVKEAVSTLGENIQIRRFEKWATHLSSMPVPFGLPPQVLIWSWTNAGLPVGLHEGSPYRVCCACHNAALH